MLIETSEGNMSEMMLSKLLRNFHVQGILDVISGIVVGKPAFRDKYENSEDGEWNYYNEELGNIIWFFG